MVHYYRFNSPVGVLSVGYEDDQIVSLGVSEDPADEVAPSRICTFAAEQLSEYFAGARKDFDLPLRLTGTPFQQAVWDALARIPYGQTQTYGQIAEVIGSPSAARAVGMACSKNPLWILIPCHRVVGNGNRLTGYAGGLSMKQFLLELEQMQT